MEENELKSIVESVFLDRNRKELTPSMWQRSKRVKLLILSG